VKEFYGSAERQAALKIAASMWVGTPFVAHANICGAGVDCVNLCAQIYMATGFLKEFNPPKYVMDGGHHNVESQLEKWIVDSGRFVRLDADGPDRYLPGDLHTFKIGRSAHHAGLVVDGPHFLHCLFDRKVTLSTLVDRTFNRIHVATYRPNEL
jgi:cell wall-associated NlpC family hydrolase